MTWPKEVMSRTEEGLVCKHNTFHFYVIKDDSFAIFFFLLSSGLTRLSATCA